jgi:hypothetical protein
MKTTLSDSLGALVAALAVGLGLAGCGTVSIPRIAVRGTTILIAVPDGFGVGFGLVLNQHPQLNTIGPANLIIPPNPASPLEDFQRGELLFALRDGPSPSSNLLTYLPARYITRVHVDEGSGAALPAAGEEYLNEGTPWPSGQVVAVVDVPSTTPTGTRYVFVERWKRSYPTAPDHFVKLDPIQFPAGQWLSWAGWRAGTPHPEEPMEIRIVENTYGALFHDTWGFDQWFGNYHWREYMGDLEGLVPRPKLRIWIENILTGERPAAWEIILQYPGGKLEITGAELGRLHRSGGFVSVSLATGSPSGCDGLSTSRISLIDPDRQSGFVNVAYRLRDFVNCGRASPSDFTAVAGSLKAYDEDGDLLSPPIAFFDDMFSF